jgi:IclR family transcriptional regulator, acetate operon repressor
MVHRRCSTAQQEGPTVTEVFQPVQPSGAGRTPSTARSLMKVLTLLADHPDGRASDVARSVLKALTLLAAHPDGVRARDVADAVGKSTSTAYYLLAGLCDEGFAVRDGMSGRYRLRRELVAPVPGVGEPRVDDLEPAVDALFMRTRKNCYFGRVERGGLEIVALRGRQGVPRIPGLALRMKDGLHALAIGKVVLALLPDDARGRYMQSGLRRFTDATITSPSALMDELDEVRRSGVAIERDELQLDFCCVAAPMYDLRGRFVATIGLSAVTRAFDAERERLVDAVRDAADMAKPLQQIHAILRREGLAA